MINEPWKLKVQKRIDYSIYKTLHILQREQEERFGFVCELLPFHMLSVLL